MTTKNQKILIRWVTQDDLHDIVEVEKSVFTTPWTQEDFSNCLSRKNCAAIVAEANGHIVGFLLFELLLRRIQLINMAVYPKHRHIGIGSALIRWVTEKLIPNKSCVVVAEVRETNLNAQLFFKAAGFKAEQILPDYYSDTHEDAYEFQLMLEIRKQVSIDV